MLDPHLLCHLFAWFNLPALLIIHITTRVLCSTSEMLTFCTFMPPPAR